MNASPAKGISRASARAAECGGRLVCLPGLLSSPPPEIRTPGNQTDSLGCLFLKNVEILIVEIDVTWMGKGSITF